MLNPSNEMPVSNYSVVQPATQQKTFKENNVCRWSVPFNAIPFFDPHASYLQVQARVLPKAGSTLMDKWRLNGNSSVIIKYIKFSVNGIVLEEIDEYNCLAQVFSDYGEDDSSRAHASVFNCDKAESFNPGLHGNAGGDSLANAQAAMIKTNKLLIPLKETALFGQLQVVPLMAFGTNLDIEIRFAPDSEVLMTYQKGEQVDRYSQMKDAAGGDIAGGNNAATTHASFGQFPFNNERSEMLCSLDTPPVGGGGAVQSVLTLAAPLNAGTSLGDLPLMVGQRVQLYYYDRTATGATGSPILVELQTHAAGALGAKTITNITYAAATSDVDLNVIKVELNGTDQLQVPPAAAGGGANYPSILLRKVADAGGHTAVSAANANVPEMEYSRCELYLQKVEPPQQYVEALSRSIGSEQGFSYDLHTFTTYKSNLMSAIQSQTIEIPAYQSRAKSVLVVPRIANQTTAWGIHNSNANPAAPAFYDQRGSFQNLKDYQWLVNHGLRVPTRPVNLDDMAGTFKHFSAEHLIQISQALGASNLGVKSLKHTRNNFVLGRQLSKYGATTNLNSAMRVYLNFQGQADPAVAGGLQTITFLNHINRISVNNGGLQVFN